METVKNKQQVKPAVANKVNQPAKVNQPNTNADNRNSTGIPSPYVNQDKRQSEVDATRMGQNRAYPEGTFAPHGANDPVVATGGHYPAGTFSPEAAIAKEKGLKAAPKKIVNNDWLQPVRVAINEQFKATHKKYKVRVVPKSLKVTAPATIDALSRLTDVDYAACTGEDLRALRLAIDQAVA